MNYTDEELKKVRLNKAVIDRVKAFRTQIKPYMMSKVLNWVAYVYHPHTPLKGADSFLKMKFEAAVLADFPRDRSGKFNRHYEQIILGKNRKVSGVVLQYLKMWNSPDYMQLKIYLESYEEELESLKGIAFTEDDSAEKRKTKAIAKAKIIENIRVLKNEIKELQSQFLEGDNNKTLVVNLYQELGLEKLGITPEEIADSLSQHNSPLLNFNPHYI